VPIERIVEAASCLTILGCVVGMGVAPMPLSVLESFAGRSQLRIQPLSGASGSVPIRLAWRKQAPQAKIGCLAATLLADVQKPRPSA
jgi:DNA-binding transcriptional LysR family regulator